MTRYAKLATRKYRRFREIGLPVHEPKKSRLGRNRSAFCINLLLPSTVGGATRRRAEKRLTPRAN